MAKLGKLVAATLLATPIQAGDLIEALFPGKSGCYVRSYSAGHLSSHPGQLVTDIQLAADAMVADPMIGLWVFVTLRGDIAGTYEGFAYCETAGPSLACGMEGDAGSFIITPGEDGTILVDVGRYGMSFESEVDFITLQGDRGDDRSFRLAAAPCF